MRLDFGMTRNLHRPKFEIPWGPLSSMVKTDPYFFLWAPVLSRMNTKDVLFLSHEHSILDPCVKGHRSCALSC